jgi:hypothetical protein
MGKKYIVDEETLNGIGDAIRSKKGMSGKLRLTNFKPLIESITSGGGGDSFVINGSVATYEAYGNINSGDYVTINNNITSKIATVNDDIVYDCILLDNGKVFIVYKDKNSYFTLGVGLPRQDGTIAFKITQIGKGSSNTYQLSCVSLGNNKVFITYRYSNYLYATIVTINEDDTITVNSSTQISTDTYSGRYSSCLLLDNNKVFIAHSYGSNYHLYATIVTINSDNTLTLNSTTSLNTSSTACKLCYCLLLENNKVFISHSYGSNNQLNGSIVTINEDDSVTLNSTTKLLSSSGSPGSHYNCFLLGNNKVFIAHSYGSDYQLNGSIVTINEDDSVTLLITNELLDEYGTGHYPSCFLLENNKVFISHSYGRNYHLYATIVTINSDNTLTLNSTTKLKNFLGVGTICKQLNDGKVFIAHQDVEKIEFYGTTYLFNNYAVKYNNNMIDSIKGVAKTDGTTGQIIEVYVPTEVTDG